MPADDGATGGEAVQRSLRVARALQEDLNLFSILAVGYAPPAGTAHTGRTPAGPLQGLPVAIKDLFDVAGLPTTGCCAALAGRAPATVDSDVVAALRAAGAVVVGKTNQDELAASATGVRSAPGPVGNPWGKGRIPGGSSSGSAAAVAAGVVPVAIGSDTGGSIRIPASFCGVTGLKPTWGRVSLRGAMPMNPALDCAGPLARSAAECAAVFAVLATGPGPAPLSVAGLRVGLPARFFTLVHPETLAAVEAAGRVFEELGATLVPLEGEKSPELDDGWAGFAHTWAEMAAAYPSLVDDERVDPGVAALLRIGRDQSAAAVEESRAAAGRVRASFERALQDVDVLLAPTTPYPAPRADEEEVAVTGGTVDVHRGGTSRLTVPVNLAGLPAVAFPVGLAGNGLPLGAQLIGRPGGDETLLGAAGAYQDVTNHHRAYPPGYGGP